MNANRKVEETVASIHSPGTGKRIFKATTLNNQENSYHSILKYCSEICQIFVNQTYPSSAGEADDADEPSRIHDGQSGFLHGSARTAARTIAATATTTTTAAATATATAELYDFAEASDRGLRTAHARATLLRQRIAVPAAAATRSAAAAAATAVGLLRRRPVVPAAAAAAPGLSDGAAELRTHAGRRLPDGDRSLPAAHGRRLV